MRPQYLTSIDRRLSSAEVRAAMKPRRRFNRRKAWDSLLIAVAVICVAVLLPLMMFVSCTGGGVR